MSVEAVVLNANRNTFRNHEILHSVKLGELLLIILIGQTLIGNKSFLPK